MRLNLRHDATARHGDATGENMQHHDRISNPPARNAEITKRYARVWKSIVSGVVTPRDEDVTPWYSAAQHAMGAALHEAAVERLEMPRDTAIELAVMSAA
jgi:hypothetical protein